MSNFQNSVCFFVKTFWSSFDNAYLKETNKIANNNSDKVLVIRYLINTI